jgi:Zn-dependent protease
LAALPALLLLAIPIIIAITFHEAAHGFAARALGDDTAAREGRLTLNPLAHIDPVGTLLVPAILFMTTGLAFGYAIPVPVDMERLRNPVRDMALVAAAGPLTNVAIAIIVALALPLIGSSADTSPILRKTLEATVVLNFVLAVLNFYPLPPLDGSKVVAALLPRSLSDSYLELEVYGFPILFVLLVAIPIASAQMGWYIDVAGYLIASPAYFLSDHLLALVGAK